MNLPVFTQHDADAVGALHETKHSLQLVVAVSAFSHDMQEQVELSRRGIEGHFHPKIPSRNSIRGYSGRSRDGRSPSYSRYSIFQPLCSSLCSRPSADFSSLNEASPEGRARTQSASPASGRRKPSTCSVSDSPSVARYSFGSAGGRGTAPPSRTFRP